MDGADAFVFLSGLAFGFRTSLFERFCPLAITKILRLGWCPLSALDLGRHDTADQASLQP